jgi:hypothetical protein
MDTYFSKTLFARINSATIRRLSAFICFHCFIILLITGCKPEPKPEIGVKNLKQEADEEQRKVTSESTTKQKKEEESLDRTELEYDPEVGGLYQIASIRYSNSDGKARIVLDVVSKSGTGRPSYEVRKDSQQLEATLYDTRAPKYPHDKIVYINDEFVKKMYFRYPEDDSQIVFVAEFVKDVDTSDLALSEPERIVFDLIKD